VTIIGELTVGVDAPSIVHQAKAAARSGLDFLVCHQVTDAGTTAFSPDEALLAGYQSFDDRR
jgi:hypothetical protein